MSTQKTSNDYREERKARLAKAAKKNSQKAHKVQTSRMNRKLKSTIGICVAVAIVACIAIVTCSNTGVFERMKKIETVSGESYSVVEFEYYYNSIHSNVYNQSMQYENYGEGMGLMYTGFDCTKLPEDQLYKGGDYTLPDGSTPTWKQYLEHAALESLQQLHILEDLAAKEGFVVDAAVLAEAEAYIDQIKSELSQSAQQSGSTPKPFSSWLRETYGKGMNEKLLREIIKRQTIASEYATYASEKYIDNVLANNTRLEEEYNKDPDLYNCVDFRIFAITPETVEYEDDATQAEKDAANKAAKEDAKKKADEMFGKITDEESFKKLAAEYATEDQKEAADYDKDETTLMKYVEKETYKTSFGEDAVNWLFNKDTKANEKKMFEYNGTHYLFYMVKTAYRDDVTIPVDVRHILYQFDDTAKDKETDKETKKASADATLNAINKSGDKLATFLEFCEKDSDDTGSSSNGGLIEYLGRGKYVKAFEEWSLDPNRKVGDVGVIETEYGYHVMYFEKKHEAPMWKLTLAQQIASEEFTAMIEDLAATDAYKVADPLYITNISDKLYKKIVETYYAHLIVEETSTIA